MYHADIDKSAGVDLFKAALRDSTLTIESRDPEHDLCQAMLAAGLPDDEIQFWRGTTPSLKYRSVHRTAGYKISLGEKFPYSRSKRWETLPGFWQKSPAG